MEADRDKQTGRKTVAYGNVRNGKIEWASASDLEQAERAALTRCRQSGADCERLYSIYIWNQKGDKVRIYLFHPWEDQLTKDHALYEWTFDGGKKGNLTLSGNRLLVSDRFILYVEGEDGGSLGPRPLLKCNHTILTDESGQSINLKLRPHPGLGPAGPPDRATWEQIDTDLNIVDPFASTSTYRGNQPEEEQESRFKPPSGTDYFALLKRLARKMSVGNEMERQQARKEMNRLYLNPEAMAWIDSEANRNPEAAFALGRKHHLGKGTRKDYDWAVFFYEIAAWQGHAGAQCNLGYVFHSGGNGVPKDGIRAFSWFHQAARHGDKDAQQMLDTKYKDWRWPR
jgi:hypothetical protein